MCELIQESGTMELIEPPTKCLAACLADVKDLAGQFRLTRIWAAFELAEHVDAWQVQRKVGAF